MHEVSSHVAQKESTCFWHVPTVWLAVETAENMAASAKCQLQYMDYICLGGHLTAISPSFLILISFYGSWNLEETIKG